MEQGSQFATRRAEPRKSGPKKVSLRRQRRFLPAAVALSFRRVSYYDVQKTRQSLAKKKILRPPRVRLETLASFSVDNFDDEKFNPKEL